MRWAVLAGMLVCVLVAGCGSPTAKDDGKSGGSSSASSTTTGPPPEPVPPFADVRDNLMLHVALPVVGQVHRLRLVAFDDFTIDDLRADGEEDGGGGGGGGGNNGPRRYGFALFPVGTGPGNATACSDAVDAVAWDGRARSGNPEFDVPSGVYDAWIWTSAGSGVTFELNGGGNSRVNTTALSYGWRVDEVTAAVTNSGPAQTTASFSQVVPVADGGGLFMGRFALPGGYPDEQASTTVESGGTCAETVREPSSFGGGGGGGGFGGESLSVAAFLPEGDATWSGTYTAALAPQGGGSAAGVLLQKSA